MKIRWDGTRLLSSDRKAGESLEEAGIEAELARMADTPFSAAQKPESWYVGRPVPRGAVEGRIVGDDEAAVRAGVIAASSDAFFCDGRFWTECPEPVWGGDQGFQL